MRVLLIASNLLLTGCSGSFEFGRPAQPVVLPAHAGETIIEPNGAVVEDRPAPIETVITGLSQAQTVRTLTRALAR
jgi:hypothetical protein